MGKKQLKKIIKNIYLIILLCGSVFFLVRAWTFADGADITIDGSWSLSINSDNLVSGAGSDLESNYESASDEITVHITTEGSGQQQWRVDVHKEDTNWDNDLVLYVKRNSDGAGGGNISGGGAYQEVTASDVLFFSGNQSRAAINVQLRLEGVSIQIPPDTYTTTVYYTIVDT